MDILFDFNEINHTNFSNDGDTLIRSVLANLYSNFYKESKEFIYIIIALLVMFSAIGSITNSYVIFVFKFIFDKKFNRDIESKLAATSNCHLKKRRSKNFEEFEIILNKEVGWEIIESYNNAKKKLLYNSNFNLLYTLISYLSFIDFFSCAIAIPVTAYEILNNQKINELCCKLFEFIRAFGVIASNFVIVMISIERYIALYKLENSSRKNFFKFRISFVVFLSGFLSILILPLVSVYQKVENRIY